MLIVLVCIVFIAAIVGKIIHDDTGNGKEVDVKPMSLEEMRVKAAMIKKKEMAPIIISMKHEMNRVVLLKPDQDQWRAGISRNQDIDAIFNKYGADSFVGVRHGDVITTSCEPSALFWEFEFKEHKAQGGELTEVR